MSNADAYEDDESDYDDQQADVAETQDETPVIRKLRKELRDAKKNSKRADDLEAELFAYKSKDALTAAGLTLNDRQARVLLRELDNPTDLSPDTLRTVAAELGFAVPDDGTNEAGEAAQKVMQQASAGAMNSASENTLSAAEFGGWDMARRVDFRNRHPDKFAALKRGESVRV